jgi:hypothetical protein
MKNKVFYLCVIAFSIINQLKAQDKRIYVSRNDTTLKIVEKYDNPMRAGYNIAGNVGIDVSGTSPGVFAELVGIYSPKRFYFGVSHAFDFSKNGLTSFDDELIIPETALNGYGNTQLSAVFNFKDETVETKVEPTVGIKVLDVKQGTNTSFDGQTITFLSYKTDEEIKVRKTKGIGASFSNINSNYIYKINNDSTSEIVTFQNTAKVPNSFVLPYSSSIIGLRFQTSKSSSYNIHYTLSGADKKKIKTKSTTYRYMAIEALFAPSIRNSDNAFYLDSNSVVSQLTVNDVKKNRLGLRVILQSNFYNESKQKIKRKPGLFYNIEFGLRPSIGEIQNGLYLKMGVGISI